MIIRGLSFENNENIPRKYTGFGNDISPSFEILNLPDKTISIAIILDDLDVPFVKSFNHWLVWNIPKTEIIPEGFPKGAEITKPINACQGIAWGKHCYRGPKQPFFVKNEHRYLFSFFALDSMLDIPKNTNKKALIYAMKGHILDEANVIGKYKRT